MLECQKLHTNNILVMLCFLHYSVFNMTDYFLKENGLLGKIFCGP